jgi:hypothetical protein
MSVKGKGKAADQNPAERPHKPVKRADPPRVSSVTEAPPTRKPKVSFQEKAIELARSKGGFLASSKPSVPCDPVGNPRGGPPSAPNNPPHPRTQAASDSSNPLSALKGFSHHVQNLRERQTEDSRRRFHGRYGGAIVERAEQDPVDPMPASTSTQPLSASKGKQPTKKCRVQRSVGGKRISKAQAHAEEVAKICRSAKSYIVDMVAIKRREVPIPPTTLPPACSPSIRLEKTVPVATGGRISKTQPQVPSPIPQLPSQLLSTSLGSIPRGLKFTRKRKTAPEPGEIIAETAETVTPPHQGVHGPRLASASRDNGPLTVDVSKRKRENPGRGPKGSSPRKKPRLGRS